MKKNLHISKTVGLIAIFSLLSFTTFSQVNRSFTGEGNNLQHPEWGAKGTNQLRVTPATYSDGVSEPTGLNRPNPRYISNTIFNHDGLIPDALTISDYAFVWGQFIDHNITLVLDSESDYYPIPVPGGDPYFDPFNVGTAQVPVFRSESDPTTGTNPENPREFPNAISSFIDGSGVYGSTQARADWLRTFENGRLRMSSGQLLPYNTVTGELGSPIDPNAPVMAMANPNITKWFVAGDVRANENALLTAMHTLFVREHNRLCEVIKTENPSWNDEQIYQRARKIVGAEIEAIVYEEWLPTMGVNMVAYTGYDPVMEPGIMNVFSVAAYRYGHSVINSKIIRMNNAGEIIPQGNILLRDAFFNPNVIVEGGGIDPLLIGMGTQVEQDFDTKMIHDLRNFLFGFPGQGGMDLAAINIQRGRERGLVDYNSIRQVFGLPKLTSFDQISDDEWFNQTFQNVY
ncbi:MAG TPA: peroxidase, partial [Saprospiraceae bacterium]|nr:peroxidase [Saprospiraceae bacterium]